MKKKVQNYYACVLSFILIIISAYCYNLFLDGRVSLVVPIVLGIIGTGVFLTAIVGCSLKRNSVKNEYTTQIIGVAVFTLIVLFAFYSVFEKTEMSFNNKAICTFGILAVQLILAFIIIRFVLINREAVANWRELAYIGAIIVLALVLSYQTKTYYMWDCYNMFSLVDSYNGSLQELLSLRKLAFFDHISYSYVFFAFLHKSLYGTAMLGQIMYSKILIIISGVGFYKLLRLIYSSAKEIECFAGATLWMVSPFITGLSSYSYNDFATWCVFPCLVYFLYSRKDIYAFITALYFVFAKESSVIIYSFLLLGIYIVEGWKNKKIIHSIDRYLINLIPCFMWLFSYKYISHWDGGGGITYEVSYFIEKLKSFFIIDFNWLILLVGLVGFIFLLVKKQYRGYISYFLPLVISGVVYIVFSCVIDTTVNHVRYIDALYTEIYILASIVPFLLIKSKKSKIVVYIAGCVLLLASSFYTIDSLSKKQYSSVNVGSTSVISTGTPLSDSWVYNRQYQNYGYIIDEALKDAVLTPNAIIYMPAVYNNTWFFDCMGNFIAVDDGTETIVKEHWNPTKNTRMTDSNGEGNVEFDVHMMANNSIVTLPEGYSGYYIYTDYAGAEMATAIQSNFNIIQTKTYEKSGWKANCIVFVNK